MNGADHVEQSWRAFWGTSYSSFSRTAARPPPEFLRDAVTNIYADNIRPRCD